MHTGSDAEAMFSNWDSQRVSSPPPSVDAQAYPARRIVLKKCDLSGVRRLLAGARWCLGRAT